jgi:hypothetical protein
MRVFVLCGGAIWVACTAWWTLNRLGVDGNTYISRCNYFLAARNEPRMKPPFLRRIPLNPRQSEPLPPPLPTRNRPILLSLLPDTARHNPTDRVLVEPHKKRHRVSRRLLPVIHAMHRRLEPVIRKPLQEIANIDNQRARLRRSIEPLVGAR